MKFHYFYFYKRGLEIKRCIWQGIFSFLSREGQPERVEGTEAVEVLRVGQETPCSLTGGEDLVEPMNGLVPQMINLKENGSLEQRNCNEKGSKAEQKAKKKQVDEDISKLSTKLKERHVEELASTGYSSAAENGRGNLDNLVKAIAGVSITNQAYHSKPSKGSSGVRKDLNRKLPENKEHKKSRARC
ncbi:unnamed protein product [Fraxinus pennsylvanica]|uniref:Uncharacterized protein n=1 Tax=Fraxinus pennsylvanica TaxID=56036 RepID=A0AAD2ECB5_9LAMI|nr:unnamed protein product [Fraxinus pennsylvanica]